MQHVIINMHSGDKVYEMYSFYTQGQHELLNSTKVRKFQYLKLYIACLEVRADRGLDNTGQFTRAGWNTEISARLNVWKDLCHVVD